MRQQLDELVLSGLNGSLLCRCAVNVSFLFPEKKKPLCCFKIFCNDLMVTKNIYIYILVPFRVFLLCVYNDFKQSDLI